MEEIHWFTTRRIINLNPMAKKISEEAQKVITCMRANVLDDLARQHNVRAELKVMCSDVLDRAFARTEKQLKLEVMDNIGFREAETAFGVLNSLGGEITGNYMEDLKRANKLNVFFSEKLYNEAYQINEQP